MTTFLIVVLFLAPIIDWAVAFALVRAWHLFPGIRSLKERAILAVAIAVATTVYFLAALNALNNFPAFDLGTGQMIARFAVASVGIVPAYWLWMYWRGRF
jgi:hypothetical protein